MESRQTLSFGTVFPFDSYSGHFCEIFDSSILTWPGKHLGLRKPEGSFLMNGYALALRQSTNFVPRRQLRAKPSIAINTNKAPIFP
jgi:hypothetical protein